MPRAKNDIGNSKGGGTRTAVATGRFSSEDIQLALDVQTKYGVPASVTLGQYALESNYGKDPVNTNNYFSVKKDGKYRTYDSKQESFDAFGQLLSNERYTSKTKNATTIKEYLQGVKDGGYAVDPNYVSKVMNVIESNGLRAYDNDDQTGITGGGYITDTSDFVSGSWNKKSGLGLEWWGDVVRVVLILLLIAGGFILLAMSAGQIGVKPDISKIVKGGK